MSHFSTVKTQLRKREPLLQALHDLGYCPQEGEKGLSLAMVEMIREERKRKRMAKSSQSVRRRFSMDRIAVEWNQVLGLEDAKK